MKSLTLRLFISPIWVKYDMKYSFFECMHITEENWFLTHLIRIIYKLKQGVQGNHSNRIQYKVTCTSILITSVTRE